MSVGLITVERYRTDEVARAIADQVMERAGLDKNDVFEIADFDDRYVCGLFVRGAAGKIVIKQLEGGEFESAPVRRWVEVPNE